jgi:hypothetical protein
MPGVNSFESGTVQLTEIILGNDDHDFAKTLQEIASEIGVRHIAYSRLSSNKSSDINHWPQSPPIRNYGSNDTF